MQLGQVWQVSQQATLLCISRKISILLLQNSQLLAPTQNLPPAIISRTVDLCSIVNNNSLPILPTLSYKVDSNQYLICLSFFFHHYSYRSFDFISHFDFDNGDGDGGGDGDGDCSVSNGDGNDLTLYSIIKGY